MSLKDRVQPASASNLSESSAELLQYWGQRIREARTARGVPRKNFTSMVGISASTLQRMEFGAPEISIGHYLSVSHFLGLNMLVSPSVRELMDQPLRPGARAPRQRRFNPF